MGSAWEVHAAFAEAGHDEEFCLSLEAFFKTLSQLKWNQIPGIFNLLGSGIKLNQQ